jgi:hypothetical protein
MLHVEEIAKLYLVLHRTQPTIATARVSAVSLTKRPAECMLLMNPGYLSDWGKPCVW